MQKQKNWVKRTLGIDYGSVRLGLAVSDERGIIASSLKTLEADKKCLQTVKKLIIAIKQYETDYESEIETIVIGMPLMLSGKVGFIADEVNHFIEVLTSMTEIPIVTWDERLTSMQAERSLRESGLSCKKQKKYVDAVSAVLILQNYLDFKNMQKE